MFRSVIAFLLAPLPAAFFQATIVAIWPKDGMGVFEHPASMFFAICLVFYVFGLFLALPLLWFFRKRRSFTLGGHVLGGMATMLSPIAIVLALMAFRGQLSPYIGIYNAVFFAIGGAAAGVIFYFIKRPKRVTGPD